MMKFMPAGSWLPAALVGLALGAGALAQSMSTHDPGSQVALQNLLNQGFEVKAAGNAGSSLQILYLQKAALLYACPLGVAGQGCSRIVSR